MTTVTGIATPTHTIPVTVSTFHNCKKIRGSKSNDSYRDGDADPHDPCDCWLFIIARRFEGPKVTTVTGIATPTPTIPVTVSTFYNCKKIRGSKSNDSYRDGDADPHDPCDC